MKRFSEVTPKILRGSAPSKDEIRALKDLWNVNRIVSLDLEDGIAIDNICESNDIEHLIIPIEHSIELNGNVEKPSNYLSNHIVSILTENPVTFIHCIHGRDRTGYAIALWRIKGEGWDSQRAINEAISFGFGQGLTLDFKQYLIRQIESAGNQLHDKNESSDTDIATKVRDSVNDGSLTGNTDGTSYFSPITPIQNFVQSYPREDTSDANDSRKRRRKMRLEYLQDVNNLMAGVGLNDKSNPILRSVSPDGTGPLGILPYGNYYL